MEFDYIFVKFQSAGLLPRHGDVLQELVHGVRDILESPEVHALIVAEPAARSPPPQRASKMRGEADRRQTQPPELSKLNTSETRTHLQNSVEQLTLASVLVGTKTR